jgi:2-haloacid dehalogenase
LRGRDKVHILESGWLPITVKCEVDAHEQHTSGRRAGLRLRCLRNLVRFRFGAARSCRDVLGEAIDKLTALWRDKQLQYTWLRAVQGRHADFWQVTSDALDFALETLALDKPGLRDRLMNLYLTLEPFPEVPEVLERLKTSGLRTAILSNGSPMMLDAVVRASRLNSLIDAVLSVEAVGIYKPHPKVYQLAVDRLGVPAAAIAFQSSNAWDAYAASAFGMQVVWCNRYGQRPERLPGKPDRTVRSLSELPALLRAQS